MKSGALNTGFNMHHPALMLYALGPASVITLFDASSRRTAHTQGPRHHNI